jgi:hypothetical protein
MNKIIACLILLTFCNLNFCFSQDSLKNIEKRLFLADELNPSMLIPENSLNIKIKFVNKEHPINKGLWLFTKEKFEIIFLLTNLSDSVIYIEPPHESSLGGNPSFNIISLDSESELLPKNLCIINFMPLKFISITPNSSYTDTIDLFEKNTYNFKKGKKYRINAYYSCKWGAFKDGSSALKKIWSGSIKSNSLEFEYPK